METHLLEHFLRTCREVGLWLIERLPYVNTSKECTQNAGIYFIFQYGELVYIGKSICMKNRLNSHRSTFGVWNSDRTSVKILSVDLGKDIEALESIFIGLFTPKYNRAKR